MAMVTAVQPSPHPILGISTAKPLQHLGHFMSPVKAMQQAGTGKVYCGLTACGLLQCLQPGSKRQLLSSFRIKGRV